MRQKKTLPIICIAMITLFTLTAIALFSTGILVFHGRNTRIYLPPDFETITRIEMRKRYQRAYSKTLVITSRDEINHIMSELSKARRPIVTTLFFWVRAANEVPAAGTYISVDFGGKRVFLYTRENRGYVHVPYIGVYRINRSTVEEFIQLLHQ